MRQILPKGPQLLVGLWSLACRFKVFLSSVLPHQTWIHCQKRYGDRSTASRASFTGAKEILSSQNPLQINSTWRNEFIVIAKNVTRDIKD